MFNKKRKENLSNDRQYNQGQFNHGGNNQNQPSNQQGSYSRDYSNQGQYNNNQQDRFANENTFQPQPQQPMYTQNDRPVVGRENHNFVKRELFLQKIKYIILFAFFLSITVTFSSIIALFITDTYGGEYGLADITGIEHLGWLGTLGILSFLAMFFTGMKMYLILKDSTRVRSENQAQMYIPLSLKKHYRALKSNNTFIHYFAFLTYLAIGLTILAIYLVDPANEIGGALTTVPELSGKFDDFAMYLGIAAGCVLLVHVLWVLIRARKATTYDAKFGFEIVPVTEIQVLKKRNRKICLFITILMTLLGIAIFYIIKKLKPSLALPNLLKK